MIWFRTTNTTVQSRNGKYTYRIYKDGKYYECYRDGLRICCIDTKLKTAKMRCEIDNRLFN